MKIDVEELEELRECLRESGLWPMASDDPALGPDAARWTPEDDG